MQIIFCLLERMPLFSTLLTQAMSEYWSVWYQCKLESPASVIVFLISIKKNQWAVWHSWQVVSSKGEINTSHSFSSHMFVSLQPTDSFTIHNLSLPLFFLFCKCLSVCLYRCLCVRVWSIERGIWLPDKRDTQALTASSISVSVWRTGLCLEVTLHTHICVCVCVWSDINIPLLGHMQWLCLCENINVIPFSVRPLLPPFTCPLPHLSSFPVLALRFYLSFPISIMFSLFHPGKVFHLFSSCTRSSFFLTLTSVEESSSYMQTH